MNQPTDESKGRRCLVLDIDYTLFDHHWYEVVKEEFKSDTSIIPEFKRPYLHEFLVRINVTPHTRHWRVVSCRKCVTSSTTLSSGLQHRWQPLTRRWSTWACTPIPTTRFHSSCPRKTCFWHAKRKVAKSGTKLSSLCKWFGANSANFTARRTPFTYATATLILFQN